MTSLPAFGPNCPVGGSWYACASGTNFVGCCARDPCSVRCPQGDLYPAGFDKDKFGTFPDASCQQGGALFYTCTSGPTFIGCCKSNPCAAGGICPRSDLDPSFLYADDTRAAYGAISSISSLRSSATRTATTLSTSSITGTATAAAQHKDGPPVAAIAGGAAGGAFAVALIIGLLVYYFCHAKKSRKGHEESLSRRQSDLPAMATVHETTNGVKAPEAPPGYSSPNPNQYYDPHSGHYMAYAHQQQQQQYIPEPQELPIEPLSTTSFSRKPVASHRRNLSELSGDTAIRSELDSPYDTPKINEQYATPMSSPATQASFGHHVSGNGSSSPVVGNWVAHQSWQTPTIREYVPEPVQGLGVQGANVHEESLQRDHQSRQNVSGYPGV